VDLGIHVLIELKECNPVLLNDLDYVKEALINASTDLGATIVGESFHKFSPQGVTGILAIAESHISVHTWPEFCYAAADIFTCGSSFNPIDVAYLIAKKFESSNPEMTTVKRGIGMLEQIKN
jgi:S-adenosylmethionine decarboxylase|tara:strand:+ start:247 stop:612 length:366 start_codon:yes stop_codon:yes gene_type:complete